VVLRRQGRPHSPPPKARDSGLDVKRQWRSVPSLFLTNILRLRIIPLKPTPDKALGREEPAPEPVLVLGECSTTRAMAAVIPTAPHLGMRCRDAGLFYCAIRVGATKRVKKISMFHNLNNGIAGCPVVRVMAWTWRLSSVFGFCGVRCGKRRAGARLFDSRLVSPYAALPAVTLWVVELSTLNVRMTGSPSMRCRSISWMAGYCSRW